jgi:Domain of unknown function (DUF4365)
MTLDDQKEQFSVAYAHAIAAVAQLAVSKPSVDDDSIDITFSRRRGAAQVRSPKLDAQLKCVSLDAFKGPEFSYALKIKNYDELRPTDLLVPRILVVVVVPDDIPGNWLIHSEQSLALHRCGYWASLRGQPRTTNTATVSVRISRANGFSSQALVDMMDRIGAGGVP